MLGDCYVTKRSNFFLLLLLHLFWPSASVAFCECMCVDGVVVPICDLYETRNPICPEQACPGSSQQMQQMLVSPTPTVDYLYCREEVVWNNVLKKLEVIKVCD